MADIVWYADSLAAPGGDGSSGSPFNTIAALYAKFTRADNQIGRIRGGRHYDGDIPGMGVSNVRLEPYWMIGDEGGKPMFDGINWLAPTSGGWTLEGAADGGGFVWSYQRGTAAEVKRVWAASTNNGILLSQRLLGEGLRRSPDITFGSITATTDTLASIKAHLSAADTWYGAGAALTYKLYVWTPSNLQDPSLYYQGIGFSQIGAGTTGIGSGISLFSTRNFQATNIDVRGAVGWSFQIAVNDNLALSTEDVSFTECESIATINHFRASQVATSTAYQTGIRRVQFSKCTANMWTSAKEQEPNQAYNRLAVADLFYINGRVEDVSVVDCTSIDPTHAACSIGGWDSAGALPKRSGFLRHTARASSWCSYARGLNVALCEGTCYATDCVYIGMNTVTQLAGAIKVTGCQWKGMRAAIRKPSNATIATDGWIAMSGYRNDLGNVNVGTDRYVDMRPDGLVFANNSCDGCIGTPIEIDVFDSPGTSGIKPVPSLQDNSMFIWNNLLIDTAAGRVGKPYLTTYDGDSGLSVGVQSFGNNAVYSGAGNTPSAKWKGTTYTNINSAPGHAGNLTVNPMVDADMRPQLGSPLIGGAKFIGYFSDAQGRPFKLPSCIGAYEDYSLLPRAPITIPRQARI